MVVQGAAADCGDGLDTDAEDGDLGSGWIQFLDPADSELPEVLGKLGPYEVVEFLGRGGMGLVLKARDPSLDRMVAIKVLTPALAHGATARRRFAREAKAVAAVGNEHIVAIHAVDEFRGLPYLVMQYVPGRSLQDRLDASGPLEIKEILRIGTQAARALAAAHAQGVVHRDIKPANILLENCIERVKLTDFGLARAIDDASVTQSGVIAGTPQYMAPEQARGEPVAAGADLFSLGAVLYAMAAGRPPFRGDSAMAVLKRVCEIPHRPVRELNPDVPGWLEALIDRLLAKDPADRFQTATEVADFLEKGLAHLQQPAMVPPPVVPVVNRHSAQLLDLDPVMKKPVARSHRKFAMVASLLLLVGAGFGASEAAGLTQVSDFVATILRIKTAEGTLVIKCSDPGVKVQVDGKDLVIAGTGLQEIRLKSGTHRLAVTKDGRPVRNEIVSVARGGKEIVNVSLEATEPVHMGENRVPRDMFTPPSHAMQCMACHSNLQSSNPDVESRFLGHRLPASHPPLDRLSVYADRAHDLFASSTPHGVAARGLIWSLAFAPDGKRLAIGQQGIDNRSSTLRVWDLAKDCEIACFARPAGYRSVAFSSDGQTLAAGSLDGALKTCETGFWNTLVEQANGSPISAVAFLPNSSIVAAGGWDGQVKFYDPRAKIASHHVVYPSFVYAIAFSPDGSTLAVAGEGKMIQLYDVATIRLKAVLQGHTHAVESLDFSPDGKLLASAGGYTVRIWDVATAKTAGEDIHDNPEVLCVRFSPDGKLLAISDGDSERLHSTGQETEITLYEVASRTVIRRLQGHANSVYALAFSPDGKILASGSLDQTIKLWDTGTGGLCETIVPGEKSKTEAGSQDAPANAAAIKRWPNEGYVGRMRRRGPGVDAIPRIP